MKDKLSLLVSQKKIFPLEKPAVDCWHQADFEKPPLIGKEGNLEYQESFQQYRLNENLVIDHDYAQDQILRVFHDQDFMFSAKNDCYFGTWDLEWALDNNLSKEDVIKRLIDSCISLIKLKNSNGLSFCENPKTIVHYFVEKRDPEKGLVVDADELNRREITSLEDSFLEVQSDPNYNRFTTFGVVFGLEFPWANGYKLKRTYQCLLGDYGGHWDPKTWKIIFKFGLSLEPKEIIHHFLKNVYQKTAKYRQESLIKLLPV